MTENLPAAKESGAVIDWSSPAMIKTLKATVAQNATDEEFAMFAGLCKSTGLNPFKKEVWFIKTKPYRKKDGTMSEPKVQIMTGINGFLAVANSHPQFDGIECDVEYGKDGLPVKAVAKVWRKDRKFPSKAEALWSEYYKPNPYGNKGVWEQMPSVMIAKCAKSLALREAFPQELNGLYTQEEMPAEYAQPEPEKPEPKKPMPIVPGLKPANELKPTNGNGNGHIIYSLQKMRDAGIPQEEKRRLWQLATGKAGAKQDGDYLLCMMPLAELEPYRVKEAEAISAEVRPGQGDDVVSFDDDRLPGYDPAFSQDPELGYDPNLSLEQNTAALSAAILEDNKKQNRKTRRAA